MNVFEGVDKFLVVTNVAIVITPLPEGSPLYIVAHIWLRLAEVGLFVPSRRNLQPLNDGCDGAALRFRDKQMDVVGHDHKAVHQEVVAQTGAL